MVLVSIRRLTQGLGNAASHRASTTSMAGQPKRSVTDISMTSIAQYRTNSNVNTQSARTRASAKVT